MEIWEVGGAVRDDLLGLPVSDVDYTVTGFNSFQGMIDGLKADGFHIYVETPKFLTVKAKFPKDMTYFAGRDITKLSADFVLARKEGTYTDGRHPDYVEPGTLEDDLRRRDFTINALAKDSNGNIVDLFGGIDDLRCMTLRCVGNPKDRFTEDALRAIRALRFSVTKQMRWDAKLSGALYSTWLPPLVKAITIDRRRDELMKMFKYDSLQAMFVLNDVPKMLLEATFDGGVWLTPSTKVR